MGANGIRNSLYKIVSTLGYGAHTEVNQWLGEPEARALREKLKYDQYYRVFRGLEKYRLEDPDRYSLYISALGDWSGQPRFLNGWVWYAAHIPEPRLVRGVNLMKWAFSRRWTDTQGVVGMHQFFKRLDLAERDFQKAAEIDPGNPETFAHLIATSGALGASEEVMGQHFAALLQRAPAHFQGHSNMLIGRYRRPGASDNDLFGFARAITDAAPDGSSLHALVPQAHIEKWAMVRFAEGPEQANAYFGDYLVGAEVRSAYNRLFKVADYRKTVLEPVLASYFAVAFFLADDRIGVDEAMKMIGDYTTTYPWNHLCRKPKEFLSVGYVIDRVRRYPHSMLF